MAARCQLEGCRAWAKRGEAYCVAHPGGEPRQVGGAPKGNQNARTHGLYANYVPLVKLEEALQLPPGDLRLEIAVMRVLLADLLRSGLPAAALVELMDRGTGALARLLRVNKHLGDDAGAEWARMVAGVLEELGLGGA